MEDAPPVNGPAWIRASEIQGYLYCARSWWLQYVIGLDPQTEWLEAGETGHRSHGHRLVGSERLGRAGLALLGVALLLLLLAWLTRGG